MAGMCIENLTCKSFAYLLPLLVKWENAKGPLFVLHDGPPYANGNLHMGSLLCILMER